MVLVQPLKRTISVLLTTSRMPSVPIPIPASHAPPHSTYAEATRGPAGVFRPFIPKPAASTETEEKDIFISLKNADKSIVFALAPATALTNKFNRLLQRPAQQGPGH